MNAQSFQMDSVVKYVSTCMVLTTVNVWRDISLFEHPFVKVQMKRVTDTIDRIFLFTDIDECVEMSDACDKSQPAPADCINLSGSHRCSCGRYSGHRLSADGTTCEGIAFLIEMHINSFPCQMWMNAVKGCIFALTCVLTHQDHTAAPVQQALNLTVVTD